MKKYCHITVAHPPFDNRIFRKECKTLLRGGCAVSLVAPGEKNATVDGIELVAIGKSKTRGSRFFSANWRALRAALGQRADLYHFHDPDFLLLGFAFILKLVSGKPVVYDVHEDYSQVVLTREWIPGFTKKTLLRLVKFWENFCSGFSVDLVVAATPTIAGNFSAKNVIVVRNFPLEDDFFGISERLTFPLGAECNLIYAGGIEPIRGIRETIRALKTVTGSRLFLLGEFGEKKFENEIKKEQFWSRVDCPGKVDFETVIEYLKKADIGIVCFNPIKRFQESLPVKMFEYMAAGVPVIASNFPAWKEMVEKNKCGICVDPLDPEKIAKAVDYLISQPERALEMGRNGRKAFYREFNWRPEGEKLIAAYGKIVSK